MKYIIDIEEKPLCVFDKDTQTYFPRLWRVKGFNSLVFDEEGLSRLEELNSDYINEHYEGLQDEAYQKGFEDGKKSVSEPDRIEVGDEVIAPCGKAVVTALRNNFVDYIYSDGDCGCTEPENLTKTGRHYDIQSILEAIKS